MKLSIRKKIMLSYTVLVIISITISSVIILYSRDYVANRSMQETALDAIQADNRAFDTARQYIHSTSMAIIANQLVQNALTEFDWEADRLAMRYVMETVNLDPIVSSTYILRPDGMRYYSDKITYKAISYAAVQGTEIYKTILARNGGYVITRNAGGLVQDGIEYFSFMRTINSLKTLRPIGLLCINVEFSKIFNPRDEPMQLVDTPDGTLVLWNNDAGIVTSEEVLAMFGQESAFAQVINRQYKNYVISGIRNRELSMLFVRCIPIYDAPLPLSLYTTIIALMILFNGLLLIFGSAWISRYISQPVQTLVAGIEGVYRGNFNLVTTINTHDEIERFQDVYNTTIRKIQQLISDIIEEQKALRRAELEITIAQINPHFLYNTLNTINSLAVMGKTAEVSETTKALGDFYKNSLSNGDDLIPLSAELDTIRSYQYIQQLRYAGMFRIQYDIQPEAMEARVPKMILQPLVENAIYHGIRMSVEEDGLITIRARLEEGFLRIVVTDNGIGMSEERLNEVRQGKSIGLGGTMRRVSILGGDLNSFTIESVLGEGTRITIQMSGGL
ncbi:MAG: sensor histidine kinase [Clostridiales bacterium]|nr:sensor histidine kinase [Clostridiales bacterium]